MKRSPIGKAGEHRFALTLLISFFVFVIIMIAVGLSIAVIYLLLQMGLIDSVDGEPHFLPSVLFLAVISMVIGFLLTMLTSRVSLKPFNRIVDQLDRLARGDFRARIQFGRPIGAHPTFRQIEESFNRAAAELEHTEMLRGDFINNFSHEFKTPIVSIAGFAKLLRLGNLSEKEKEEYLAIIEDESLRLSAMANKVLGLTQVENQNILTDVTTFNLSEQLRSAILLLADKWQQKDLDMDIEIGEYTVEANRELLKQVWINLLDNAVKFSPPGCTVSVTVQQLPQTLSVTITNQGRDIPPESLPRIFNKFYQADESHATQGTGIGLAIVSKAVRLHSGDIRVRSEDGITSFTVTLPRSR